VEIGNTIWNTFLYCNFFQISTDYELFKIFIVKAGLTGLCSYRLIASLTANPPELHFGQEVIHSNLQSLGYYLVDIYKLYPQIDDVM
jgi:hypothetical protein